MSATPERRPGTASRSRSCVARATATSRWYRSRRRSSRPRRCGLPTRCSTSRVSRRCSAVISPAGARASTAAWHVFARRPPEVTPGGAMTAQGGGLTDPEGDEVLAESASARALSARGEFARGFDGFRPRPAQQAMAARVEHAIERGSVLIAESGTGTGKTFAYLVPVLLSGARVIVSTGTRHLQDQLFGKDLPAVRRVLGAPARVERLKGRANYLCLHRLEQAGEMTFGSAGEVDDLARVREFARSTSSGDISEARGIADDAPIWARLTTGSDGCLGARCDFIN